MATHRVGARLWLIVGLAAALAVGAAVLGWRWWTERYTVAVADDGAAVTRVVSATLRGASALKVSTLSGIVQASAADARLGGLLQADQVVKAPFSVDYFVNVDGLSARDLRWDQRARTLTVDVSGVIAARPNIDLGHRYLVRTRGLIVTRGASEELGRKAALGAERAAAAEANRPERLAQARENARRALGRLLAGPLEAAGLDVAAVRVRFPDERNRSTERWDVSRAPAEVLSR